MLETYYDSKVHFSTMKAQKARIALYNTAKFAQVKMFDHVFMLGIAGTTGSLLLIIFWYLQEMNLILKEINISLKDLSDSDEKMITSLMDALFRTQKDCRFPGNYGKDC